MTWYTFFKSVHVIAAVIWVGGAAMIQALAFRIVRTGDGKRQADFAKDTEIVGMRLFIPTTWILLLAGIGMMISWGMLIAMLAGIAVVLSAYLRGEQSVAAPATE